MSPTIQAGVNAEIVLAYHANEPSITGETTLGFLLAKDNNGQPLYSVVDDAARSLVQQVSEAGYPIDPETLEVVFKKEAWNGPCGAYTERPGANSPAFGVNIDFRRPKAILAMKTYSVGRPTLTLVAPLVTFNFEFDDQSLNTDGGDFARFAVGDTVTITGTTNNNWTKTVVTSAAGKLTFASGVVDETPATATITARAFGGMVVGAATFDGVVYVTTTDTDGSAYVYKLSNWTLAAPSSAYWIYVWKHTTAGTPEQLFVHNSVMYLAMGVVVYAYTTNGSTWTLSTQAGDSGKAHRFAELNGFLQKMLKQASHQGMATKAATGKNTNDGGTAWPSANQIGETTTNVMEMLSVAGSLVFPKEDGMYSIDSGGNIRPLSPDLFYMASNGLRSEVWHQKVFYPMVSLGHLWALIDGRPTMVTPGLQQEKAMEVIGSETTSLVAPINALLRTPQYLFASLDLGTVIRILSLEETQQGMIWRTLVEGNLNSNDFLWLTTTPTSGPVLWANNNLATKTASCWLLSLGPDPLQDSNSDYASSGVVYEPWLDMGCSETNKRWAWLELVVTEKTVNSGKVSFQVDAYTEAGNQIITAQTVTFASTGLTRVAIPFTNADVSKIVSRRMRLVLTLGNTGSGQESHTPVLVSYRVHAYALPTSRRRIDLTLLTPTGSVTHGLTDQSTARTFFNQMRSAKLPMTLTDMFGTAITVEPAITVQEVAVKEETRGWSTAWRLSLVEQVLT